MADFDPALLQDGSTSAKLRVLVDPAVHGVQISWALLASGKLTAIREQVVKEDLFDNKSVSPRLTRDNPLLDPAALDILDENGLIRPDTIVKNSAVLASVIQLINQPRGSLPAPGMVRIQDGSLVLPGGWDGATVKTSSCLTRRQIGRSASAGLVGRILIRLELVLPVSVGDVLLINGSPHAIAGICDTDAADIVAGTAIGNQFGWREKETVEVTIGVAQQAARWAMQARATGPYSLITHQPLGVSFYFPGQRIYPQHIHTLRAADMLANSAELVTFKSDDIGGRMQLNLAIQGKADFPTPGLPESFHVLLSELKALGFSSSLADGGGHVVLSPGMMTDSDRLKLSFGTVSKPETINYRTYRAEKDGLFCERIFGPERDWECSCGKYEGTKYEGTICERCGVKVTHSRVRRWRFGTIQLPDPIIPWFIRVPATDGGPSVLARLLNLTDSQIVGLLAMQMCVDEKGTIAAADPSNQSNLTGPLAIEHLLSKVPNVELPEHLCGREDARSAFATRTLLVLPPDLRPLVLLHNGNFATSDLNDHYRRVINRANRLRKLNELKAPSIIIRNELRMLQETADSLFANTFLPESKQVSGSQGKPLKDLLNMALYRATWRDGKRVDYSARARIVPSADVPLGGVMVPQSVASTLQIVHGAPVLLTRAPLPGEFAAPIVSLAASFHDHYVIGVHPVIFSSLFVEPKNVGSVPECIIHRPLTPSAMEEATSRMGTVLIAPNAPVPTWQDASDAKVLNTIVDAALTGKPLSFDSPAGVLLAGTGATELSTTPPSDASETGIRPSKTVDIPIPPEPPVLQGPDLLSRMRDLAMDHRRNALIYRWQKLGRPSRPEDGTVGIGPWLPPGFQWPHVRGKPLEFVAQLPVDPARTAGVLPPGALVNIAPGTLLTLFWNHEEWEPRAATPQLLSFIPHTSELVRHPVDESRMHRLFKSTDITLVPEIVEEVPSVVELREMFDFEFGTIDPKVLAEFEKTIALTLPTPQSLPKFGGWAAWIQGADSPRSLLLQVPSDEVTGLNFGDCGTLYATCDSGDISLSMQCY